MPFFSKRQKKTDFLFEKSDIVEPDLMLGKILMHHLKSETLSNENTTHYCFTVTLHSETFQY